MPAAAFRRLISFGPFEFDSKANLLYRGGREVVLPLRAAGVLRALLDRPGEVLSKDELLGEVWKDAFVGEDSLTHAISMVRQALGDDPQNPTYIQTVPKRGYRFIAALARDGIRQGVASTAASGVAGRRALPWGVTFVAVILTTAVLAWTVRNFGTNGTGQPHYLTMEAVPGTEGVIQGWPQISPDGTRFAYIADVGGQRGLYLRSLGSDEATLVPSAGPRSAQICFSPDGSAVGYRDEDELKRVLVSGGAPVTITRFSGGVFGFDWGPDDTVYVAKEEGVIYGVPAGGGELIPVVEADRTAGEAYLAHPEVLPGGRAMLYNVSYGGRLDDEPIYVIDLETKERKKLIDQGSVPKYASSGHIVFARRGQLLAAPFDLGALALRGDPVVVRDDIFMTGTFSRAAYDLAANGTLVYVRGGDAIGNRRLILVDGEGREELVTQDRDSFMWPRFSPDGRQIVASNIEGDILVYEVGRGAKIRLNLPGIKMIPFWSPHGEWIVYSMSDRSPVNVYRAPSDGSEPPELLWESLNTTYAISASWDGRLLAIEDLHVDTGLDISILRLGGGRVTKEPYLATQFQETGPMFSPTGPWIAYGSDESSRSDVYVEPYPRTGERFMVSTDGGTQPVWARDGSRLFYKDRFSAPNRIMVVDIQTEPKFQSSTPRAATPEGRYESPGTPSYDVAPDGRFVVVRREDAPPQPTHFQVVPNWFEELKRLAPRTR